MSYFKILLIEFTILFLSVSAQGPEPSQPLHPQWTFYDGQREVYCVLVRMQMNLSLSYTTKDQQIVSDNYKLPDETIVHAIDGVCSPLMQYITLAWGELNDSQIYLQFDLATNTLEYSLSFIELTLNVSDNFPNAADNQTLHTRFVVDKSFTVAKNAAFECQSIQQLYSNAIMEPEKTAGPVVMELSGLIIEAFHEGDPVFSFYHRLCSADQHLVNMALILLSILGLTVLAGCLGYCYFSRRCNPRGYSNM